MSQFVSFLILALVCKLLACASLARVLVRPGRDVLESFVAAWLIVHVALTGVVAVLAAAGWLTGAALWAVLVLLVAGALGVARWRSAPDEPHAPESAVEVGLSDPLVCAPVLAALATFAALTYHGILFPEVTTEGPYAAIPRVQRAAESSSLLPLPGPQVQGDGWNGELSGLSYMLLAGDNLAMGFGRAEFFLASCFGFAWLAGVLGAPARCRAAAGFLLAAFPLALGAYAAVRGDALAGLGLLLALGWALRACTHPSSVTLCAGLAALGVALGARAWAAIPVAALLLPVLWAHRAFAPRWFAAGALLFAIGAAGFVAGLLGPHGVDAIPEPAKFAENLRARADHLRSDSDALAQTRLGWGGRLALGFALVGVAGLVWCVTLRVSGKRERVRWVTIIGLVAVVIAAGGNDTATAGARPLVPLLVLGLAWAIVALCRWAPSRTAVAAVLVLGAAHAGALYLSPTQTPTGLLEARSKSPDNRFYGSFASQLKGRRPNTVGWLKAPDGVP